MGAGHCFLRARRGGLLSAARLVRVSLVGLGRDIRWYVACPTFQHVCQAGTGPGGTPVVTGQGGWRVGPLAWTLTGVSLVACGVGYYLMHLDALHGYKQVWPVNVFLGAVLALVATSGYVAMKIFQ